MDLTIHYNSVVISVSDVTAGSLAAGWGLAINDQVPGKLRVALAGTTPIETAGELLPLTVTPLANGSSPLHLIRAQLNEGRVTTAVAHGKVFNCPLFEDGFESGDVGDWD